MVKIEDLYTVYELARANKRRSADAVLFEIDYERKLKHLCQAINDRIYRCTSNYTFICLRPKPREIFACELEARLLQWYIVWRLGDIIEKVLTKRTYNNRKKMGVDVALKQLQEDTREVSANYTRDAYYIQWDLQGYFPSADCMIVTKQLQRLVTDYYKGDDAEDLMWMIDIVVNAEPKRHCYRKSPIEMWSLIEPKKSLFNNPDGKGGAIGFLIWQTAMNLYLNDIDHWAVDTMGLHYIRFVDDTVITVQNKEAALTLLPLFREKYAEFGCTIHPKKFYCQHISKGIHFLGSYIKFGRMYIANRTIRKAEYRIRLWNKCSRKRKSIEKFQATINSYFGLLKNRNEFKSIQHLHSLIDKKWWEYMDMDWSRCCVVAKPQYKHRHYLRYRFNALFPSLRMRPN